MQVQRWVVKVGSQMVCSGGPLLMRAWMQQLSTLRQKHQIEVIWVTSGAIAWASARTNFGNRKRTLPQKQALSAVGQPLIMDQYNLALAASGLLGAQVLLTIGDIRDKTRRQNLQNTLKELLRWGVIPILNENDAVATEEIRFGDNDSLASHVAVMMKAKRLILMTDVDGLYSADPKRNPKAELIAYRAKVGSAERLMASRKSTFSVGTGGMASKLGAAHRAQSKRIITHLVRGDVPNNLLDIATGKSIGTQIGGRYDHT
jgi:glutamate 5-kinase